MIHSVVIPVVVIVALVALNGAFVAAEFAIVAARPSRVAALAGAGGGGARWVNSVLASARGKDRYIAVAQLGITLASIGLGMYAEPAVAKWMLGPAEQLGLSHGAAHTIGFGVALSAITYMHIVFGEMIPKVLALQAPEATAVQVAPIARVFSFVFRPVVVVLNAVAVALMRLLRIPEPDAALALHTSAELAIVTSEAADGGQIGDVQRDLIRNIFDLESRRADEIMTSRSRMDVLDVSSTSDEVAQRIAASARSRYPVVDGDPDNVVGVLHIKEFIRAARRADTPVLPELVRPLPSVAPSTPAAALLDMFKRDHTHAAVVVDEFGGTLGFVTMDDVIAEVMDDPEPDNQVTIATDGSYSIDGEAPLVELSDDHGIDLVADGVTTIAGVFLAAFGAVPAVGDEVITQGYRFTVTEMAGMKVTRIAVTTHP